MKEKKTKKGWIWVVVGLALILVLLAFLLTRCSGAPPQWQEHYDLGMRYLSDGNYQEAILAFSAAIEIDPNVSDHYLYRGDAYVLGAKDMLGQEEPDCDQAVIYLQSAEDDYRKAQELNAEADIAGRMEEVENLEKTIEALTAVPEVVPFYEEAGLEVNTIPDTTEKTDELAVRQASWSTDIDTEVYYGTWDNLYQNGTTQACPVTVSITEYSNLDMAEEPVSDEEKDEFHAFLEAHPDYKLITADYVITFGPGIKEIGSQLYGINSMARFGVIDRYSGVLLETQDLCGSGTLNYKGDTITVYSNTVLQGRSDNDMFYGVVRISLLAPQDYDGALFYVGYSNEDIPVEGTSDFPLYSSMPGTDTPTKFFALPEE